MNPFHPAHPWFAPNGPPLLPLPPDSRPSDPPRPRPSGAESERPFRLEGEPVNPNSAPQGIGVRGIYRLPHGIGELSGSYEEGREFSGERYREYGIRLEFRYDSCIPYWSRRSR